MYQVPCPLSTPHRRLERRRCPPVPGLARQLTREIPTPLVRIYPPGQLECPLHCLQEYPGKITHIHTHTRTRTDCECEALDWWIGTTGYWFYWLVVCWESVVHDYMMIFPRMFFSPPPPSKTSFFLPFPKPPSCLSSCSRRPPAAPNRPTVIRPSEPSLLD